MNTKSNKQIRARYITVFATFLAFMGIGVVDPLLPIIAARIGASSWQIEMLFTAYILTMAIMMIPSGIISNRLGNKKMMVLGLIIVTIFSLLCGISNGIFQLSIFRAGWGLGNSLFLATGLILIISFSADANSGIGLYEGAMGLGMSVGPLVGGFLGDYSWRYPFLATGFLVLIAVILVSVFVYEPEKKTERKPVGLKELIKLIKFRPFLSVAISAMFYYYSFFVILAYSPLVIKLTPIQLGGVFFGWGLMLAIGSAVLAHRLEKNFLPKAVLPWSLFLFVIILGCLFFFNIIWIRIILIILSGLVSGLNNTLFTSYVMEVSPYERGVTSGAYNFVRWLGAAIAPVLSGALSHAISPQFPFEVAAFVTLFGVVLIIIKTSDEIELEEVV